MKRSLLLIGVAIAAVAAALVWTFVVSRGHDREIAIATHDGARTAIILPAGHGPKRTVIVLHGAMMTAEMTAHDTGFDEAAAKHGFTAIFPRGLNRRWHDERVGGWNGPDDVAFLKALIARLVAEHIALPNQIYIAGISSGGEMSFTMACLAGDLIRGLGAIVATMPEGLKPCTPPAMPVVMFDGTADPLVPYTGGKVSWLAGGGELWSVEQTAEYFARRNGCGPSSTRDLPSLTRSAETSVTEIGWRECASKEPVLLYRVNGGGHQIPGKSAGLTFLLGRGNRDISAAETIISAFARENAGRSPL